MLLLLATLSSGLDLLMPTRLLLVLLDQVWAAPSRSAALAVLLSLLEVLLLRELHPSSLRHPCRTSQHRCKLRLAQLHLLMLPRWRHPWEVAVVRAP